jgi:hypothetical protein
MKKIGEKSHVSYGGHQLLVLLYDTREKFETHMNRKQPPIVDECGIGNCLEDVQDV